MHLYLNILYIYICIYTYIYIYAHVHNTYWKRMEGSGHFHELECFCRSLHLQFHLPGSLRCRDSSLWSYSRTKWWLRSSCEPCFLQTTPPAFTNEYRRMTAHCVNIGPFLEFNPKIWASTGVNMRYPAIGWWTPVPVRCHQTWRAGSHGPSKSVIFLARNLHILHLLNFQPCLMTPEGNTPRSSMYGILT